MYQKRADNARKQLKEEEEVREELFEEKLNLEKRVADLMTEIQRMEEEQMFGGTKSQKSGTPSV